MDRLARLIHFGPTWQMTIHGFCDASEKAYAAAVYTRTESNKERNITSKTKVAPVKRKITSGWNSVERYY